MTDASELEYVAAVGEQLLQRGVEAWCQRWETTSAQLDVFEEALNAAHGSDASGWLRTVYIDAVQSQISDLRRELGRLLDMAPDDWLRELTKRAPWYDEWRHRMMGLPDVSD